MVTPVQHPEPHTPDTPPAIPPIPPDDDHVRAVRSGMAAKLTKMARDPAAVRERDPDLFGIGFGLLSGSSATPRGVSGFARLVRAEDWAAMGFVMSRARRRPGGHRGYMRAECVGGAVFEAYCGEADPQVTGLYYSGRPIGAWRSIEYSYDGRFRQPLWRELWSTSRRLGLVDSALLTSGAAVLELDQDHHDHDGTAGETAEPPKPHTLIPLRIKRTEVIEGNPFAEIFKATPFGKRLGPRKPNLDLVLAPQAAWLPDPADQTLLFVASLALRTLILQKFASSSD